MRIEELVYCADCPDRAGCATPENRCAYMHWLAATTAASGVPFKVADPQVLRRAAALMGLDSTRPHCT